MLPGNAALARETGPGRAPGPVSPRSYPALHLLLSRGLVLIAMVAQVLVAWRFWATTWDDSAITLGFARTFAQTGRIEPTPGSGIVEGYSTTLWMLLMTVAAKLVTGPAALLTAAKLATLVLNLANLWLMRAWFRSWTPETVANLVAGSVGCGWMFAETINGMETPLMLTLVLGMLLLRGRGGRLARGSYLLLGVAFLLTRWEAAWLLVSFVLVEGTLRRVLGSSLAWLVAFAASNLARWRYFGSVLPNTILAKRNEPYTHVESLHRHVADHVYELLDLLLTCKLLCLVVVAALLVGRFVYRRRADLSRAPGFPTFATCWQLRFTCLFVLCSLVLVTAIGPNWGPPFRAFYSAWPFLYCLMILPLACAVSSRALPWGAVALCLLALGKMHARVRELEDASPPFYMHGATIANVDRINGILIDILKASHRQELLFAGPDMGAILLYSQHVRVLDLGLLCDPVLARRGFGAVNEYVLQQRRPDVIEVHMFWITLTGVEHLDLFRQRYRPVYVRGVRVFLSRELVRSMDPHRLTEGSFDALGRPLSTDVDPRAYILQYKKPDYSLNRAFGRYLVLR